MNVHRVTMVRMSRQTKRRRSRLSTTWLSRFVSSTATSMAEPDWVAAMAEAKARQPKIRFIVEVIVVTFA